MRGMTDDRCKLPQARLRIPIRILWRVSDSKTMTKGSGRAGLR